MAADQNVPDWRSVNFPGAPAAPTPEPPATTPPAPHRPASAVPVAQVRPPVGQSQPYSPVAQPPKKLAPPPPIYAASPAPNPTPAVAEPELSYNDFLGIEEQPPAKPASEVTININLPKVKLSADHLKKIGRAARKTGPALEHLRPVVAASLRHKRRLAVGAAGFVVVIALGIVGQGQLAKPSRGQAAVAGATSSQATAGATTAVLAQPDFSPVVPKDKPQLATPDDKVSKFDGTKDSYVYEDTLGGTQLIVSEQPMPTTYGATPEDNLAKIASKLGAKQQLSSGLGTAYLASNTVNNSQTIIATNGKVLIFVQSSFQHDTSAWVAYLSTLQ